MPDRVFFALFYADFEISLKPTLSADLKDLQGKKGNPGLKGNGKKDSILLKNGTISVDIA